MSDKQSKAKKTVSSAGCSEAAGLQSAGLDGFGSSYGMTGWAQAGAFIAPALDGHMLVGSPMGTKAAPPAGPGKGVLVIGMGRETHGDNGVGLYLMDCLARLDWPTSVTFVRGDACATAQPAGAAKVILLDAVEGPEAAGSLYQLDPEEMLSKASGGAPSGMGMALLLPKWVRSRMVIFGIQPRTRHQGSSLSTEVLTAMPILVTYLRGIILKAVGEVMQLN